MWRFFPFFCKDDTCKGFGLGLLTPTHNKNFEKCLKNENFNGFWCMYSHCCLLEQALYTINFMFLSIALQRNACLRVVHLVSTNWMPLHCCIEFMVYSFVIYTFAPGASRFALIISWMNWRTHISSTIPNVLACALYQHCFSAFLLHHPFFCVHIVHILHTTIHPFISMENFRLALFETHFFHTHFGKKKISTHFEKYF